MWNNLFNRDTTKKSTIPLFDEAFMHRLERFSFRTSSRLRGHKAGERRSKQLRPSLDFSNHRHYTPGDDWRYIDWNVFSRHEELFVKLGETTQSVNIHILLDCSRSMAWDASQSALDKKLNIAKSIKWNGARRLAAALGYIALAGGEGIEITAYAHTLGANYGPFHGKRQAVRMLQFLTNLTPAPYQAPNQESGLVNSLIQYAKQHPKGGMLILVSDLLDTANPSSETKQGWEELAEGLRYFPPPRWQVLVMHLLSEAEVKPTLVGDFDLQDMESEELLPFHLDEGVLEQYRQRVNEWCGQLQSACAGRASTYARILAEWPFEKAVIPYLRQRGAIQ